MKLIFKPEDFKYIASKEIWEFAQAKFDQWLEENGKVVWGEKMDSTGYFIWCDPKNTFKQENPHKHVLTHNLGATHKAILVCIEPIEQCKHPKEKVLHSISRVPLVFECECGAKVAPKEFEEV